MSTKSSESKGKLLVLLVLLSLDHYHRHHHTSAMALTYPPRRTTAHHAAPHHAPRCVPRLRAALARRASAANTADHANHAGSATAQVLGGTGFVGSQVCRIAVQSGFDVTAMSRRGVNPSPGDQDLDQVSYVVGDATDAPTVDKLVADADAVVHAVGLLFDVDSGLKQLNLIGERMRMQRDNAWPTALPAHPHHAAHPPHTAHLPHPTHLAHAPRRITAVSGSRSTPGEASTYDRITRLTAFNVIGALKKRIAKPFGNKGPVPFAFVSAAEAGWPEVTGGEAVEKLAPDWLSRYLVAKRAVEAELDPSSANGKIRPIIYRPSLIWNWQKLDVLPIIPIFNAGESGIDAKPSRRQNTRFITNRHLTTYPRHRSLSKASAIGIPFVDKTVRVETLASAIVAGIEDGLCTGVKRFPEMEELASRL